MTVQLSMDRIQVGQYLPGCRTHGRYVRAEAAEGLWRVRKVSSTTPVN